MTVEEIQKVLIPVLGIVWSNEIWDKFKEQVDIGERQGYRLASKSEREFLDPPDLFYPKTMGCLLFVKVKSKG